MERRPRLPFETRTDGSTTGNLGREAASFLPLSSHWTNIAGPHLAAWRPGQPAQSTGPAASRRSRAGPARGAGSPTSGPGRSRGPAEGKPGQTAASSPPSPRGSAGFWRSDRDQSLVGDQLPVCHESVFPLSPPDSRQGVGLPALPVKQRHKNIKCKLLVFYCLTFILS